jgi:LmbE family N-acetylglucosaminyl deacetylase
MKIIERVRRVAVGAVLLGISLGMNLGAQQLSANSGPALIPLPEPSATALPLPEDRGAAAVEQAIRRLKTTASVLVIVAHPDDEDGALLTYLSRVEGARVTLLTLTRGEGGQNAMGSESYDALGLVRTNELLRADEYYGVQQLWGTEADFGFSKTQEESFSRWGHERVLYDAVLAVRRVRPQVILSTFVGGVSDGHGHHQVSGEIAQEALRAAADPNVFPDQVKAGFQPWQAQAVYSMTPFARIQDGKMFDYATGKWAAARFKNYVTGEWTEGVLSADVTVQVGERDPVLGRSPLQIAREGWGEQKSQYGGANPALSGPAESSYHLWAVAGSADATPFHQEREKDGARSDVGAADLFHNQKVEIDTSISGLAGLTKEPAPSWLSNDLNALDAGITSFIAQRNGLSALAAAHKLTPVCKQTLELRMQVAASNLEAEGKASLLLELDAKIGQFQAALQELLGLDMAAFRADTPSRPLGGPGVRGGSAEETPRTVSPGEELRVRVHATQATTESKLDRVWLKSRSGDDWKSEADISQVVPSATANDEVFKLLVAENAQPTQPYFSRPSIEQPYYDLIHPEDRERSFAPYPLEAWAEFSFDGVPIRIGQVVQTLARVPGKGGVYEPLVVTPAIGVQMEPEALLLPDDGKALEVHVRIHAQKAAAGSVVLKLPQGWRSEPAEASFDLKAAGDSEPILFLVKPVSGVWESVQAGAYTISAEARVGGQSYATGWRTIGYPGLRPYNLYKPAVLNARKVDVKLASGLRVGYVMGTGDPVPQAIESLGGAPHLLSTQEITSGELSQWNVIVIGIRAYSVRPELSRAESRLEEFVRRGGTLVVQYQDGDFPAPAPLVLGRAPEKVVEEVAPVKLIDPTNALLNWPNHITSSDFDGWVEERGHSFLESWDKSYTDLTETADAGQDPQRGGLVVGHFGNGSYVYVAFALHRQLPELVPGAYRLLANLLSAGRE